MLLTAAFAALAILYVAPSLGAPLAHPHPVEKYDGETTGRYLVTFKPGTVWTSLAGNTTITHKWEGAINGFAGHIDAATLEVLQTDPNVETISEDGIMHTVVTQTNAPWGLSRLSSSTKLANTDTSALTFPFTYDASAGAGVDIYIVDTGVFTSHFHGRAHWGATFGDYPDADGNGHGTHCAGTAAGSQFGVAKAANVIAIKVLSDAGDGSVADIVSGLNFVLGEHSGSEHPSVVSMSLSGGASTTLDNAVATLTKAGIHVVVAAGNSNSDAGLFSPARAPSAITVGATNIQDQRSSFSNFGSVVDIFAPGENVISSWIGSITATNSISGTSMATPHVAGLVAYLIGLQGDNTPDAISAKVKTLALKGVLTGIPAGTINDLAHNGAQ